MVFVQEAIVMAQIIKEEYLFWKNLKAKLEEFDENCDETSKIKEINCLIKDDRKYCLFIILSILSLGIVNILSYFYTKIKLKLLFISSNIRQATHVEIVSKDGNHLISEAKEITLPGLTNSILINYTKNHFNFNKTKIFSFRHFKYIYCPKIKNFMPIKFKLNASYEMIHRKFINGLNEKEVEYQKILYPYEEQKFDIIMFLLNRYSHPLYIFQILGLFLSIITNYIVHYIALFIFFVFLLLDLYDSKMKPEEETNKNMPNVNVLRSIEGGKQYKSVKMNELVPGDIIEIPPEDTILSCDILLLSGSVLMDESSYKGNPKPVYKNHTPSTNETFTNDNTKYILYSASKIVHKKVIKINKTLGMVVSTGYDCKYGQILRKHLNHGEETYPNYRVEFTKYIFLMLCISTIFFAYSVSKMISINMSIYQILEKFCEFILISIPPTYALCFILMSYYTNKVMKSLDVNCRNNYKLSTLSRIDTMCFDKTGTLTAEHMNIYGFLPIFYKKSFVFDKLHNDITGIARDSYNFVKRGEMKLQEGQQKLNMLRVSYIECLATCHSLYQVNGRLIGNPADIAIFNSSQWILKDIPDNSTISDPLATYVKYRSEKDISLLIGESPDHETEELAIKSQYKLGITRRFEFSPSLRRMSVIVKNVNEEYYKVYSKGSPEKIRELCKSDTIPDNFDEVLERYTKRGFQVIAMACKLMKMDYIQSQKIQREYIETNMIFLGFVILENKLRSDTMQTIQLLKAENLKLVVVSGDNLLTTYSVAKSSSIINKDSPIYLCDFIKLNDNEYSLKLDSIEENDKSDESSLESSVYSYKSNPTPKAKKFSVLNRNIQIDDIDIDDEDSEEYNDDYEIDIHKNFKHKIIQVNDIKIVVSNEVYRTLTKSGENLAITGYTFDLLLKIKETQDNLTFDELFLKLINKVLLFARMTPDNKENLVKCLKTPKNTISYVGDGVNDITAMNEADVGIVANNNHSFNCMTDFLIPEIKHLFNLFQFSGRTFYLMKHLFKLMAILAVIKLYTVMFLIDYKSSLSNNQFLLVDLFLVMTYMVLFTRISLLSDKFRANYHNDYDLINMKLYMSLLAQSITNIVFIHLYFWILNAELDDSNNSQGLSTHTYHNTIGFFIYYFQTLIIQMVNGSRRSFICSISFIIYYSTFNLGGIYLIIIANTYISSFLGILTIQDTSLKVLFIMMVIINFVACYLIEHKIVKLLNRDKSHKTNEVEYETMPRKSLSLSLNQMEMKEIRLNLIK